MKTGLVVNVTLRYCALLAALLTGRPDTAFGQLIPYDNFNASSRLLSPDKWQPLGFNGLGLEASRRIDAGKLRLALRAYGYTFSDTGYVGAGLCIFFRSELYTGNPH